MPAPRTTLLTLGILAALALPLAAEASIKIAGNASNPSMRVNARGVATVTWTKNGRQVRRLMQTPRANTTIRGTQSRQSSAPTTTSKRRFPTTLLPPSLLAPTGSPAPPGRTAMLAHADGYVTYRL